jgi:transcription antitermination factor NusG
LPRIDQQVLEPSILSNRNPQLPDTDASKSWFAVYTTACHEKRVALHFQNRGIESFLPLYRSLHRWNNGCKVMVEQPLFPCYIFARIQRDARIRVIEVPGVLSLVGTRGTPAALPDAEIESLRSGLQHCKFEPHPYLVIGERARIKAGPLAGMEGVLVRKKNDLRVVLTLELIMKSVAVEVEAENLESVAMSMRAHGA